MRTLLGFRVERITKLDLLRLRDELLHELVVNLRMDEDTRTRTASLTVVPAICGYMRLVQRSGNISKGKGY